jgi:hypothetical protein
MEIVEQKARDYVDSLESQQSDCYNQSYGEGALEEAFIAGYLKGSKDTQERILNEFYDRFDVGEHAKFNIGQDVFENQEIEDLARIHTKALLRHSLKSVKG